MKQLTLLIVALCVASAASAKDGSRLLGFTCQDKTGAKPERHFNLDMKKRKWLHQDGEVSTLEFTDTEARIPQNPYLFAQGMIFTRVLNRTTLQYVEEAIKTDGSFRRRTEYGCQIVPPHTFGANRQF